MMEQQVDGSDLIKAEASTMASLNSAMNNSNNPIDTASTETGAIGEGQSAPTQIAAVPGSAILLGGLNALSEEDNYD